MEIVIFMINLRHWKHINKHNVISYCLMFEMRDDFPKASSQNLCLVFALFLFFFLSEKIVLRIRWFSESYKCRVITIHLDRLQMSVNQLLPGSLLSVLSPSERKTGVVYDISCGSKVLKRQTVGSLGIIKHVHIGGSILKERQGLPAAHTPAPVTSC